MSPVSPSIRWTTLFLALTACSAGQAPTMTAADSAAVDRLYVSFREAYAALDADRVAGLYAEDALYAPSGAPGFERGRGYIRENFRGFFNAVRADSATLDLRFRFERRFRSATLASDAGYYRLSLRRGDSTGRATAGKFVTIARRDSTGQWRFSLDMYSDAALDAFEAAPDYEP
ncbi:MAG: SgcJ/EcaC family oxidoreductase [Gemmatimonadales bacterium]